MLATRSSWQQRWQSWRLRTRGGINLRSRPTVLFAGLGVLLIVAFFLNVGTGAVAIGPVEVTAILLNQIGLGSIHSIDVSYQQSAVLTSVRIPRVVQAMMVGGALAVAGACLQGVFRNPLAEPGLIGVSAGASFGATLTIVMGLTWFGIATLPLAAFLGGLIATFVVYAFARSHGRTEVVTLILTGIAVNAIAGAATGFLTFMADDEQLRSIVFWSLGTMSGSTWNNVAAAAPFILFGLLLLPRFGSQLNLLVLGENEARHLGVSTERVRLIIITLAALMTGAAVAVAGTVGFVGLVVPHLIRLVAGPDHRYLVPASALGGAVLILMADLVARMVVIPAELPLGVVTALTGGPFFLWLLHRTRQQHGGWG